MKPQPRITRPTSKLDSLIFEAQDLGRIVTLKLRGSEIILLGESEARPPCFIAVGTVHPENKHYNVQVMESALGDLERTATRKLYRGYDAARYTVESILNATYKSGGLAFVRFESYGLQQRHAALFVVATGKRNAELVEALLVPLAESEEKDHSNALITQYMGDLPDEILKDIKKGNENNA